MSEPTPVSAQVPGLYHRRIGDLVITAVNDGTIDLPFEALLGITPADAQARMDAASRGPRMRSAVNTYLVRGGGRTVLIDAGAAGGMGPTLGRMPANLAAAGVHPGDIDLVLLTHLHGDHIGGLVTPEGAAAFPNAEIALAQDEMDFWLDDARMQAAPDARKPSFRNARTTLAAYEGRVRPFGMAAVASGITPVPLPGHTPGHTGFRVGDGADAVLVWGDVIHVPDIQAAHPEVGLVFDTDPDQAIATRRRILDQAATDRLTVAGMHMHFPGFAHVVRAGDSYTLVWDIWDPALA